MDSCPSVPMAGTRTAAISAFGLSWPLLVGGLACLGALNANLLNDADTYWHLAAARWMFEHRAVPTADPFSHTMAGTPWVTHEWLSEVLLGAAHRLLGWTGVIALAAAAYAAALALLCRFLLRRLEPVYALGLTALAALLAQDHLLARPHVLAYPLIAAWGIVLVSAREEGRAPAWPWVLLIALWANLHGSFTLGLGLAAFFAAEALGEAPAGERGRLAKAWGGFVALALGAALLTPNGVDGLAFSAQVNGMDYSLAHIAEWRSPDFQHFQPLEVALLAGGLVLFRRGLRLPLPRAILVLGLVHLALKHGRHTDVLGLLLPIAVAAALGREWGRESSRSAGAGATAALDRWFLELSRPAKPPAMAAGLALVAGAILLAAAAGRLQPPAGTTPEAALKAVQAAAPRGAVMNSYNFGGYLIYAGIPPAIDGRADMYGDAYVEDYIKAINLEASDRFVKLLDKYGIGWTLFSPDTPAVALLDYLPGWRRIYADKTAVVHIRTGGG
ncbi:MAG TPA: hypothetical protein VFF03_11045 [Rhodocyclaceae bacterium]|nr:hypothetical protein [Rhodocyclaceae bacterium]